MILVHGCITAACGLNKKGEKMTIRKIELMYKTFGKCEGHTCSECSNLETWRISDRVVRKCAVYGLTYSEASDWAKRHQACGMFNKEWHGNNIIKLVRPDNSKIQIEELEGQESFFVSTNKGR